jgi:hypothetical protein
MMYSNLLEKLQEDDDTIDFAKYLYMYYSKNIRQWAYCFRIDGAINTNMHLESMHRTLKYNYFGGKIVPRLDKAISELLNLVNDKCFDELIRHHRGKYTHRIQGIRLRHDVSLTMSLDSVLPGNINEWTVQSGNGTDTYTIVCRKPDCDCDLKCLQCDICICKYACTCLDRSIKYNMCKHIHLLCRYLKKSSMEIDNVHSNIDTDTVKSTINVESSSSVSNVESRQNIFSNIGNQLCEPSTSGTTEKILTLSEKKANNLRMLMEAVEDPSLDMSIDV